MLLLDLAKDYKKISPKDLAFPDLPSSSGLKFALVRLPRSISAANLCENTLVKSKSKSDDDINLLGKVYLGEEDFVVKRSPMARSEAGLLIPQDDDNMKIGYKIEEVWQLEMEPKKVSVKQTALDRFQNEREQEPEQPDVIKELQRKRRRK